MMKLKCFRATVVALLVGALSFGGVGCVSDSMSVTEVMGDAAGVYGAARSLGSSPSSVGSIYGKATAAAYLIATVEKYARLSAQQKAQVESIAQKKYDANVQREKSALSRSYGAKKSDAKKETDLKIAKVKADSAKKKAAAPDAGSKAKIEQDEKKQIAAEEAKLEKTYAKIDDQWYSDAQNNAEKKYGTDFAVPVKNSEGKPVVAFASVKNGKAVAQNDAYVLANKPASGKTVAHNNKQYQVTSQSIN